MSGKQPIRHRDRLAIDPRDYRMAEENPSGLGAAFSNCRWCDVGVFHTLDMTDIRLPVHRGCWDEIQRRAMQ